MLTQETANVGALCCCCVLAPVPSASPTRLHPLPSTFSVDSASLPNQLMRHPRKWTRNRLPLYRIQGPGNPEEDREGKANDEAGPGRVEVRHHLELSGFRFAAKQIPSRRNENASRRDSNTRRGHCHLDNHHRHRYHHSLSST